MGTTWDPDNLRPEDYPDREDWWDAGQFFDAWLRKHFEAQGAPSAKGGLESSDYDTQFFMCRECAALVLSDGRHYLDNLENLNTHRGWHDQLNEKRQKAVKQDTEGQSS